MKIKSPLLLLALGLPLLARGAEVAFSSAEHRQPPLFASQTQAWPWAAEKASAGAWADMEKPVAKITPFHFGNNTSWWSGWEWNLHEDRVAKAKQGGMHFWRYPGGSSSDFYFWNHQYGKYAKAYNGEDSGRMAAESHLDFDHFMELCKATGSEPLLTLNYGLARYGSLKEALDLATGWIKYAKDKGYKIRYVEVGNENYGNWEGGSDKVPGKPRLSGEAYGADFQAFVKALKAVDPELKVGAVIVGDDGGDEWTGFLWWNRGVMTQVKDHADFLAVHEYFLWPFDQDKKFIKPTNQKLLGNLERIGKIRANLDDMQDRYMGKRLPIAFDEFNIINASPPQTIQAVNLLFTAGALGEFIRHGFATANIWDWKNGLDAKEKGDHGMLATNDPEVPEATPRPSYYAYAIWKQAGGDELVESGTSGAPGLRAYASRFPGGQAGWVLVNENESKLTVTLETKHYRGAGKARAWVAMGEDLDAKTVSFNGEPGPVGGGGPFPVESLKPYTLKAADGKLTLALPGASVTGIVLY
jgi:hypothetical protein